MPKDILSGIIMAAVSIPISMGYAQIAGVPAVYGLYGSVLPILLFAMLSTSKQFIFGVDAAPAAIVGAALATLGVTAESAQALQYVPLIALFTGLWLLLFYLLHADKIVDFISTPVMGGFISGIAVTIIMMQIPKLMGSPAGTGEFIELAEHIFQAITKINWLSFGMGIGALVILIVSKKLIPKFPMAIVIMIAGVLSTIVFHVNQYGVVLLQAVQPGLPRLIFPDFTGINLTQAVGRALIKWMVEKLGLVDSFNQIETLATSVKNNDGVYLVPAFTGLGAPWWKPDAKAAIWGMTLNAGKAHVLRAGLESIAYQVKDLIDMMTRQAGIELKALRVDGGPTKNQFLMQFQADMLHAVINRSEIEEASALGAVVMNGFARKKWASFQEAAAMRTIDNCIAPCMEEKELQSLYSGWREAVKKVIGQNN